MKTVLTSILLFYTLGLVYGANKVLTGNIVVNINTVFSDTVTIQRGTKITVKPNAILEFRSKINIPNEAVFEVDSSGIVILPAYYITTITPQWFGATGIENNHFPFYNYCQAAELQGAINCASKSNIPLNLGNKKYYTSKPLIANNVEIYGSEMAFIKDTKRWHRNASLTNAIDNGYLNLFQYGKANEYESLVKGATITSKANCAIITTDGTANLHDFGIIGYLGASNQIGLQINSNVYSLKNISIIGIGGTGIYLPNGLQMSSWQNVNCSFNKNYGAFISHNDSVDSPQEYLEFNNCHFTWNKLSGLYLDSFRKRVTIHNCNFSGNGWYEIYDNPTEILDLTPGIYIKTPQSPPTKNPTNIPKHSSDIVIEESYAEDLLAFCKIESQNVLNGITIKNNVMLKGNASQKDTACLAILTGGGYIRNVDIIGNSDYGSVKPYFSSVSHLFGVKVINPNDENASIQKASNSSESGNMKMRKYYQCFDVPSDQITPYSFTIIPSAYSTTNPEDTKGGATSVWILNGAWNATNGESTESYLITITKLPNGNYYGNFLKIGQTGNGCFNSTPTLNTNGHLETTFNPWCIGALQRIDLLGDNLQNMAR